MGKREKGTYYWIEISRRAEHEINSIFYFIREEKENPSAAIKVKEKLLTKISDIGLTPFANKKWEGAKDLERDIRKANCLSWIILYEVVGDKIEILKIIHRSKDNRYLSV